MARTRVVSRKLRMAHVKVLCVDFSTEETFVWEDDVLLGAMSPQALIRRLDREWGDERTRPLKVLELSTFERRYAMPEREFFLQAKPCGD